MPIIEMIEKKMEIKIPIRFIGGGAVFSHSRYFGGCLAASHCTIEDPQNFGAVGAALLVAAGLGELSDLSEAKT